jgi:Na+/melibiose symporter-like transporter
MGIFSGVGQALTYTLPNAMMSDVTDLALLRTKRKQEGLMFSAMEIVQSLLQVCVTEVLPTKNVH